MTKTRTRTGARAIATGALILGTLVVSEAGASSARIPEDRSLAARSELIAEVTVLHEAAGVPGLLPSTEYTVLVDRVLQGTPGRSTLVVRVPGGQAPGGLEFFVPGSPRLVVGEAALVFLQSAQDGVWLPLHLGLGVFQPVGAAGERVAARAWPEPAATHVRDYDAFVRWLERSSTGERPAADYWRPRGEAQFRAAFELSLYEGQAVRWFEFDDAGEVVWHLSGAAPAVAEAALGKALGAWSGASGSPVRLAYAGPSAFDSGFDAHDWANTVLFGDPSDLIAGQFRCDEGGVLALGGWWIDGREGEWEGESYNRIIEGDVVVNEGVDCLDDSDLAEMLTHELGHALGFEHSCGDVESGPCDTAKEDEAIMRSYLHGNGRGARLAIDDRQGTVSLYGGDPVEEGGERELERPEGLTARHLGGGSVRLDWQDVAGEKRYQIQMKRPGERFTKVATEKRDTSTTVVTVSGASGKKVKFRVRAVRGKVRSAFSKPAKLRLP